MTLKQFAVAIALTLVFTADGRAQESANFHHIHLNVVDPPKTIDYYEQFFSGVRPKFRNTADAILTDRSFLLLNKVEKPAA